MRYEYKYKEEHFESLLGRTITEIRGAEPGSEEVRIVCTDGTQWGMSHSQNCCEYVRLEEVVGDPQSLVGDPVLKAEESTNHSDDEEEVYGESQTWTFYRIATVNGILVLRWLGESNGYYSESVDFYQIKE